MSVRRQLGQGLILFVALGTLLGLPGTANAAPAPNAPVPNANAPVPNAAPVYPPAPPRVRVSTTRPRVGSWLGIAFTGFRASERVSVDVVPRFRHLGSLRANRAGNGYGSVRIPGGLRGTHILVLTGLGSGRAATAIINILGPGSPHGGMAGGPISGGNASGGAGSGTSSNAGQTGGPGSGGISGSQSAGGSAGLASTGFAAFDYGRIAGALILAGAALALIGRRARRRGRGTAEAA